MQVSDLANNLVAPFSGTLLLNRNMYIDESSKAAAEGTGKATMWTAVGFFAVNVAVALSTYQYIYIYIYIYLYIYIYIVAEACAACGPFYMSGK